MSKSAHVTSFDSLAEFDQALGQFATATLDILEVSEREVQHKLSLLQQRCEQREAEVRYWQRVYDEADSDEDDIGFIARKLEEAEDESRNSRRWLERAESYCEAYFRRARHMTEVSTDHALKAHDFLQRKIAELYDYVGVNINGSPGTQSSVSTSGTGIIGAGLGAVAEIVGSTVDAAGSVVESIANIILPRGFEWVRLDELSPQDVNELPSEEKSGVSSSDVRKGLELLRDVILPEIKKDPGHASSDYFFQLDQKAGRQPGINSLQGVYDAFFGGDHIWVDRRPGDSYYRIGNGRHRIKAAIDLGLWAIPSKIQGSTK